MANESMTLGQAYVQIMPSAQGIKKQVEGILGKELDGVGEKTGKSFGKKLVDGMNTAGKNLTKYITAPAVGAATAVAGIVGALGFKRLMGMDVAKAKLQGLGYEGKQLETIMNNARNAVQGTTFATADGAYVAAGALAAGVKEGKDLERYISLVGDAAIGANAPIEEMAQIFNRVQSSGELTRNELEMLNYRLPGFSNALMKHVGAGSTDAFYEMLRAGKVGTNDLLDVMEDFAGGMSAAYANTWSGLKDNILSNIGIIGEALLEGLFEDGKKGMSEFLNFLRNSDGLKQWARDTGESIRDIVQKIVTMIKGLMDSWGSLDNSTKDLIKNITKYIGIFIVAAGPILLAITKIIGVVTTLISWFRKIKTYASIIGTAISGISAPVLIVVGVIAGLIAIFVHLYKTNENFRDGVMNVWNKIKEVIMNVIQAITDFAMNIFGSLVTWWNENNEMIFAKAQEIWGMIRSVIDTVISEIVSFVMEIWTMLTEFWDEHGQMIMEAAQNVWSVISTVITTVAGVIWTVIKTMADIIQAIMVFLWPFIESIIISTWNAIKGVIQGAIKIITGIIQFFAALFTGNWSEMWAAVKQILSGAVQFIWNFIQVAFVGRILKIGKSLLTGFTGIMRNLWSSVTNLFKSGINNAYRSVTGFFSKFKDAGKKIVTSIADGIKGAIGKVTDAIKGVTQKVRDFLPFSPPKTGPLIDIMDVKWGETIAGGIDKGKNTVAKAMDSILDFDLAKRAKFNNPNTGHDDLNKDSDDEKQPIILQVDGKTFAKIMGDYTSEEGGKRIRRYERGLA